MIRLIFLLLLISPLFLGAQNSNKKARQLLLNISKTETIDGFYILKKVDNFKFQKYLSRKDTTGVLRGFGTVVHESCHELNSIIGNAIPNPDFKNHNGYFITKGIEISLLHEDVYNAVELNKFVPKKLKNKIFRYGTYIGDPKKVFWMSSQVNGVYGMLDEFDAYYHGTKAQLKLYNFYFNYRCNGFENTDEWTNYLTNIAAEYYAYYEFNLFISWYLQYAKLRHPDTYEIVMNHADLRIVYTLLDNLYSQLIDEYYTIQKQIISKLNTPERKVSLAKSDGKTWIVVETKGSVTRSSIQDYEAHYLEELLESEEHNILNEFKIEGVTTENYMSFLKGE